MTGPLLFYFNMPVCNKKIKLNVYTKIEYTQEHPERCQHKTKKVLDLFLDCCKDWSLNRVFLWLLIKDVMVITPTVINRLEKVCT